QLPQACDAAGDQDSPDAEHTNQAGHCDAKVSSHRGNLLAHHLVTGLDGPADFGDANFLGPGDHLMKKGMGIIASDSLGTPDNGLVACHRLEAPRIPTTAAHVIVRHDDVANFAGAKRVAMEEASIQYDAGADSM